MGSVIAFRPRAEPPPTHELATGELVILSVIGSVSSVAVLIVCESGNEAIGPCHIILRSPGIPDEFVARFNKGPDASVDQFVGATTNYAHGIVDTISFAARHPNALANAT